MWARRCGAPPRWPSRAKVLMQSFMTAAVGYAVYQYMTSSDVGYLDLSQPMTDKAICLQSWPLRHNLADWGNAEQWEDWAAYREDMTAYMQENQCASATNDQLCSEVYVPLQGMRRNLGIPLGIDYHWANDSIEMYGYLFLFMTLCLWFMITLHDLALLTVGPKDYILDLRGIRKAFPCWRKLWILVGFRCWKRLIRRKGFLVGRKRYLAQPGFWVALVFAPLFVGWGVVVFMAIIVPAVTLLFFRFPIRLSRVIIFLNCLANGVYGLILTVHCITFLSRLEYRQQYAVTWQSPGVDSTTSCVCGCMYPLSFNTCFMLMLIGIGVAYKAIMLAMRCLKGLRCSNWANLLSVMFPIPLNVYEVMWTQPDGWPIMNRKKGDPVQAEPAFDPFALMDEQLDSSSTTLTFVPTQLDPEMEPQHWTVADVESYLQELGLGQYCEAVNNKNIDGPALLQLLQPSSASADAEGAEDAEAAAGKGAAGAAGGLHALGVRSAGHALRIRNSLGRAKGQRAQQPKPLKHTSRLALGAGGAQQPREMSGPAPNLRAAEALARRYSHLEYIGCCGFPCILGEHGGKRPEDFDDSDAEAVDQEEAAPTPASEGAHNKSFTPQTTLSAEGRNDRTIATEAQHARSPSDGQPPAAPSAAAAAGGGAASGDASPIVPGMPQHRPLQL